MSRLICALILLFTARPALAADAITLNFEYARWGVEACRGNKTLRFGEPYLLCEGVAGDKRFVLKAEVQKLDETQVRVKGLVEETDSDGHIIHLSRPSIVTMKGERAQISQGDEKNGEAIRLTVSY